MERGPQQQLLPDLNFVHLRRIGMLGPEEFQQPIASALQPAL